MATLALLLAVTAVDCFAAEMSTLLRAKEDISADQIAEHVQTLASDAFEGREAGSRGGREAVGYVRQQLAKSGITPAGPAGSYVQPFGPGFQNVLAMIPGSDPELSRELIVLSAHLDHVGFGSPTNSRGPVGFIHNGADDNASGTSALLEVARVMHQQGVVGLRTIVFAFWDAEEKGLLGSKHWLQNSTPAARSIALLVNLDMVGRLRDNAVTVIGSRCLPGQRSVWASANLGVGLQLQFPWHIDPNSDHYPFLQRGIPAVMLHTGLHEQYHRPSDDAHLINEAGTRSVCQLLLQYAVEAANRKHWPSFRPECLSENAADQADFEREQRPRVRLGIAWDPQRLPDGTRRVTYVWPGSPADQHGLQIGDQIVRLGDDRDLANDIDDSDAANPSNAELRRLVRTTKKPLPVTWRRGDQQFQQQIPLAGSPRRLGIAWRTSPLEPNALILTSVAEQSPAARAGLQRLDRVLEVNGEPLETGQRLRAAVKTASEQLRLLIERDGNYLTANIAISAPESISAATD